MERYSAFQQVNVPEELFSVYCSHPMTDGLNTLGKNNIADFKNANKRSFKAYTKLKTGGVDWISKETETSLKQATNEKNYHVICEYFTGKDILTCMRWFVRGLSLGDAIRKVHVDLEVSENAINSSVKSMFY